MKERFILTTTPPIQTSRATSIFTTTSGVTRQAIITTRVGIVRGCSIPCIWEALAPGAWVWAECTILSGDPASASGLVSTFHWVLASDLATGMEWVLEIHGDMGME